LAASREAPYPKEVVLDITCDPGHPLLAAPGRSPSVDPGTLFSSVLGFRFSIIIRFEAFRCLGKGRGGCG